MGNKKLKCDICGITKNINYLFRCGQCKKVCCDEHTDDDYAICPECREND